MKNYGDLGGSYPPRPTASTDNTLLDLHNSSQDTQPHSLIVKYSLSIVFQFLAPLFFLPLWTVFAHRSPTSFLGATFRSSLYLLFPLP